MNRFLQSAFLCSAILLPPADALAQSYHHRSHRGPHATSHRARAGDDARSRRHARRHHAPRADQCAPAPRAVAPVPQDLADLVGAMRRMRVEAVRPPPETADRNARAPGTEVWFLLPSCRAPDPAASEGRCDVARVEVEAIGGTGSVLLDPRFDRTAQGEARRMRGFMVRGAPVVRVQLVGPSNEVRLEGVVDGAQFAELPAASSR